MTAIVRGRWLAAVVWATVGSAAAHAPAEAAAEPQLFALELRIGPKWDASKPAAEQTHFSAHSAHLRQLREAGQLVLGARYGDKGLVVLSAPTLAAARALVEQDPALMHGTFSYELHPMRVFYPGAVAARAAR
jgi:uncharacterized protein YciI